MDTTLTVGLAATLLLAVLQPGLAADAYKWKDANAVTTYSQLPPANGVRVERIRTAAAGPRRVETTSPTASAGTAQATGKSAPAAETPQQRALREQLDQQEQARLAGLTATRQSECQRARGQFDQLTQFARMRVQDEDGKVRVMPEEERRQVLEETKGRIVEFCDS